MKGPAKRGWFSEPVRSLSRDGTMSGAHERYNEPFPADKRPATSNKSSGDRRRFHCVADPDRTLAVE